MEATASTIKLVAKQRTNWATSSANSRQAAMNYFAGSAKNFKESFDFAIPTSSERSKPQESRKLLETELSKADFGY